jgi:hypothetical protein
MTLEKPEGMMRQDDPRQGAGQQWNDWGSPIGLSVALVSLGLFLFLLSLAIHFL